MINLNLPIVFAHRGANSFAPENSLSAFQKAIDLGCDGIELDVRFNIEGQVIVFHDRQLLRMTGTRGNVFRTNFEHIKKLHLRHKEMTSEKIPLLQDVLSLAGRDIRINLDVKKDIFGKDGFEERIVKILYDFNMRDNIIISSFNPFVLKNITDLDPNFHLGYIFRNRSSLIMFNGQPVTSLHPRHQILTKKTLFNLRMGGYKIYPWTVDKEEDMLDLIRKKVDGIITNRPELYLKIKDKIANNEIMQTE